MCLCLVRPPFIFNTYFGVWTWFQFLGDDRIIILVPACTFVFASFCYNFYGSKGLHTFLRPCDCIESSDDQSATDLLQAGDSIFLGFELETAVVKKELEAAVVVESQSSSASKSAGASDVTIESEDMGPRIELLWSFQCPLTKGYNVTSIDWNKTNRVCHIAVLLTKPRWIELAVLLVVAPLWVDPGAVE